MARVEGFAKEPLEAVSRIVEIRCAVDGLTAVAPTSMGMSLLNEDGLDAPPRPTRSSWVIRSSNKPT
jgi:hypothetical protein